VAAREGDAVLEPAWANFPVDQVVRTHPGQTLRNGLLVSDLLFESVYTRELTALGYAAAQAHEDELVAFLHPWINAESASRAPAARRSPPRP
jgi:hypothetical protein